jgi:hypothetical protein
MKKLLSIMTILSSFDLYGMIVPAGDTRIDQQQNNNAIMRQFGGQMMQLPQQGAIQRVVARTDLQHNFVRNGNNVRITFRDRDENGINIDTYSRDYPIISEAIAGQYRHNLAEGFSSPIQNLFANVADIPTLRGDRRVLIATEPSDTRIPHQYTVTDWQHDNANRRSTPTSTVFITDQGRRIDVDPEARIRANSVPRNHISRGPATPFYIGESYSEGNDDCRRYVNREFFDRPDGSFYYVDSPEQVQRTPKPRPTPAANPAPPIVFNGGGGGGGHRNIVKNIVTLGNPGGGCNVM